MSSLEEALTVRERERAAPLSADELCQRHAARVYRFAVMLSTSPHDADDLAQTALERSIRALPKFDPHAGSVEGWLWRIVVNAARDAGRAARRRQLLVERWLAEPAAGPAELEIPETIGDDDLLAAVRRLPKRQRTLLALRFGADLEYRRVGDALGISPGAARLATRRALLALRRDMEDRS